MPRSTSALSRFFAFITISFGEPAAEATDSLTTTGTGPFGLDMASIFGAGRTLLIIILGVALLVSLCMLVRGIFLYRLANDNRGLVDQSRSIIMTVAVTLVIITVVTAALQWFGTPDAVASN